MVVIAARKDQELCALKLHFSSLVKVRFDHAETKKEKKSRSFPRPFASDAALTLGQKRCCSLRNVPDLEFLL